LEVSGFSGIEGILFPNPEVFRFFHTQLGTHFYTASSAERDQVIAQFSDTYTFEGPAYSASATPLEGYNAVYRFFHKQQGSHFYTASAAERDNVIAQYPDIYTFEGAAYFVPPDRGSIPSTRADPRERPRPRPAPPARADGLRMGDALWPERDRSGAWCHRLRTARLQRKSRRAATHPPAGLRFGRSASGRR
jgi:hypothetical protein